jgi:hypothetical protein
MPWNITILNVETRYGSVTVRVAVQCDDPQVDFERSYDFNRPEDMTEAALKELAQQEVNRIGGLYQQAIYLKSLMGKKLEFETAFDARLDPETGAKIATE